MTQNGQHQYVKVNIDRIIAVVMFMLAPWGHILRIPLDAFGGSVAVSSFVAVVLLIKYWRLTAAWAQKHWWQCAVGVVVVAPSVVMADDRVHALASVAEWFVLPVAASLVAYYAVGARVVFGAIAWSGIVVVLTALGQATQGTLTYDGRLRSVYDSPNILGMVLVPALLVMGVQALKNNAHKRVAWWVLCILGTVVLLATQSYGAVLALVSGALCFVALAVDRRVFFGGILAMSIIGLASIAFASEKTIETITHFERSPLASRIMIWDAAVVALREQPLVGYGFGSFQGVYLTLQRHFVPYLEWSAPTPHNLFLATWFSGGILLFIAFWLAWVWLITKNATRAHVEKDLYAATAAAVLVALFFHGLVDTPLYGSARSWLALGVVSYWVRSMR